MFRFAVSKIEACFSKAVQTTQFDQIRTTFVLKRRWPPALDKVNGKPKPLKTKNFIYDLVEDQNVKREPDMKLILTSYVEGIGMKDEIVSVRPNFGRNKLLLPGLAVYASPENLEKLKQNLASKSDDEIQHSSRYAELTRRELSRQVLAMIVSKENPWTIERWHIKAAFRRAGFWVPEAAIELYKPERLISGPNMDYEGKQFLVSVKINNLEQTYVRCKIHHWIGHVVDGKYTPPTDWRDPPIPIFEEDSDLFATLPVLSKN